MKTTNWTRLLRLGLALVGVFGFCSCYTTSPYSYAPNTKAGAVGGSLVGAALGGIIGHQSGRGLEGAAIGAGAGALAGGVLGSAQDDANARRPRSYGYTRTAQDTRYYGEPGGYVSRGPVYYERPAPVYCEPVPVYCEPAPVYVRPRVTYSFGVGYSSFGRHRHYGHGRYRSNCW